MKWKQIVSTGLLSILLLSGCGISLAQESIVNEDGLVNVEYVQSYDKEEILDVMIDDEVSEEHIDAYMRVLELSNEAHYSREGLEFQLTFEGYEESIPFALSVLDVYTDWDDVALHKALEFPEENDEQMEWRLNMEGFTQEQIKFALSNR